MGCLLSKPKKPIQKNISYHGDDRDKENEPNKNFNSDANDINTQRRHDEDTLSVIKKDLNETPEMFVLNNVLMCTIFLKNYQVEVNEIFNKIRQDTKERFIKPDLVMAKANENVTYRPLHGPKKDSSEPLVIKRIYVPMDDFIEVYGEYDNTDEIRSDAENKYQLKMEESRRNGFVRLKRVNQNSDPDVSSIKDLLTIPSGNMTVSSDTESEATSKGTIDNHELIKDQNDESTLQDCFVFRKAKKADIDINLENLRHTDLTEDDVYDVVSYLSSRNFMKYFQSQIFKNSVARELGLNQYEIDYATVDKKIPGKILCSLVDVHGISYLVEVLPCLKIPWPERQTFTFFLRKGSDTEGSFIWPTQDMLNDMKLLDCNLVPKGYLKKRRNYTEGDLDWEIHFPLAERYLECLLRPEQIKCYLILLALCKEYIEPYSRRHSIGPEHLRTLIFWESEIDYNSWPGHRLGIRLMKIIRKFSTALGKRNFPDYFIGKNKNVLKNIPRRHLSHANEAFHRIIQSPLTFIIRALRNLRTTSGKFYPPLNYKELLGILYKKNWDTLHPILNNLTTDDGDNVTSSSTSLERPSLKEQMIFDDAEKQLKWLKEQETRKKLLEKEEKLNSNKKIVSFTYSVATEPRRESQDSINDNWECEKHFDVQKKIALLKFFINNYLEIAKRCSRIGSLIQSRFYLKQAWYLTKIFEEESQLFKEEVEQFFVKIQEEEKKFWT